MNNQHWDELKKSFLQYSEKYESLRDACEEQVATWEWFKRGEGYGLEPFYFERIGISRGRRLDKEPLDSKKCEWLCSQYGLNKEGKVIVLRDNFNVWGQHNHEEFFTYKDDGFSAIRYSEVQGEVRPIRLIVRSYEDRRITKSEWVGLRENSLFNFEYSKSTLVKVECYDVSEEIDSRSKNVSFHESLYYRDTFNYDGDILDSIVRYSDNLSPRSIYQRPRGDQSLKLIHKFIYEQLVREIPRIIASAQISEQAYCLALVYADDNCLPPSLGVGLSAERDQWLEEYRKTEDHSLIEAIWNPAEFTYYGVSSLEIKDIELIDACYRSNQELRLKGSTLPARRLLNQIASDLMKMDWQSILNTTSDFVVYATDFEQADFLQNLKASIPRDKWAALKGKGYL